MIPTTFLLFVFLRCPASPVEFWIQPDKFLYDRTEAINIKFLAGQPFQGTNWMQDKEHINCLQFYFSDVVDKNLIENFGSDPGDSLQLAMIDEGTAMLTLNTRDSLTGFHEDWEEKSNGDSSTQNEAGKDTCCKQPVILQHSIKTILQVGNKLTNAYGKKTELPLDIVLLDNPYSSEDSNEIHLQVHFMGQKLKKATLTIWHASNDGLSREDHITDTDGKIYFSMPHTGEWMITCVKKITLQHEEPEYYQASLTWGYY